MNSKQLKAQRRRILQKQKKRSVTTKERKLEPKRTAHSSPHPPPPLHRKIEFDQMTLGPSGVLLKTVQGVILKVETINDFTGSTDNNCTCTATMEIEILTISLLSPPKTLNKRAQNLLGHYNDNEILRLPRSELLNFRFIN